VDTGSRYAVKIVARPSLYTVQCEHIQQEAQLSLGWADHMLLFEEQQM